MFVRRLKPLTLDAALRIVVNVAKLPDLAERVGVSRDSALGPLTNVVRAEADTECCVRKIRLSRSRFLDIVETL
jgi:hypothetical protein